MQYKINMYAIVVYDVNVSRQNQIREFLRKYLYHVQRSVFEGEISPSSLYYMKKILQSYIGETDSLIIYVLRDKSCLMDKIVLGEDKDLQIY
ncbi:NEQ016 [Nanoarchaeum equitans Kin4-M]|uniref:CRISPR-associated endoribonuclease Cas2 n=1 Tax=Nanoarchaeum equitans (strain Kin4-M) TaxID=228908 RepID=CAS2_NANEQ|nr:RecName: Full=CRISPR-associated endoribonuclease Cas2 [Nanoarchaeum equitans Kin4-M]AAR38871.1 NEQ016 [Nanoarchaeum equitans Kin4-M]